MRYTEKELAQFGCSSIADLEGRLNYRPPSGSFSQSGFKERWFKLKANFLFYFRINELGVIDRKEPAGVFVLENSLVQSEVAPGIPFAFSLVFRGDDAERKHVFSTRSEDQVQQWVSAITACSYEYWRSKLRMMQNNIKRLTGRDPLLMYPGYNESIAPSIEPPLIPPMAALSLSPVRPARSPNRRNTSFKSHLLTDQDTKVASKSKTKEATSQRPALFQSHLPASHILSLSENTPNSFSQSGAHNQLKAASEVKTNVEPLVAIAAPPRSSRSTNRQVQDISAPRGPRLATRVAPPSPAPPSTSNNLIEF